MELITRKRKPIFSPLNGEIDWVKIQTQGKKAQKAIASFGATTNVCIPEVFSILTQLQKLGIPIENIKTFGVN